MDIRLSLACLDDVDANRIMVGDKGLSSAVLREEQRDPPKVYFLTLGSLWITVAELLEMRYSEIST